MSKKLQTLEIEILKAENVLSDMDIELCKSNPSYETLKALASEVIERGKRLKETVERDKKYFK